MKAEKNIKQLFQDLNKLEKPEFITTTRFQKSRVSQHQPNFNVFDEELDFLQSELIALKNDAMVIDSWVNRNYNSSQITTYLKLQESTNKAVKNAERRLIKCLKLRISSLT